MPLLELTLTQLWKKQTNAKLTHNIYEAIGGVKKSIANHAKEVYEQLNDEKRKKLEQIFIQLINLENLYQFPKVRLHIMLHSLIMAWLMVYIAFH